MPLVWPEAQPVPGRSAMRVAALAVERGRAAEFVLAASRLAFCGGYDVDDPEILAEAAAAADLGLDECLHAAGELRRDGADGAGGAATAGPGRRRAARARRRPLAVLRRAPPARGGRRLAAGAAPRARRRAAPSAAERRRRCAPGRIQGDAQGPAAAPLRSDSGPRYPRVVLAFAFLLVVLRGGRRRAAAQPLRRHLAGARSGASSLVVGGPRRRSRSAPPCGWATGSCARPTAGCAASARPRRALAAWSALAGLPVDLLRFGRGLPVVAQHDPDLDLRHARARRHLPELPGHRGRRDGRAGLRRLPALLRHRAGHAPRAGRRLARPARRRRPRQALGAAARQAARRAAGHQRRHRRRRRRPGLRRPEPAGARRRGAGRARRRLHALLRALARCSRARSSSRSRTCARGPSA